jgi:hypothetical protein
MATRFIEGDTVRIKLSWSPNNGRLAIVQRDHPSYGSTPYIHVVFTDWRAENLFRTYSYTPDLLALVERAPTLVKAPMLNALHS